MNTLNALFDWVLAASLRASILIVAVIGILTIAGIAKAAEDKPDKAGDVTVQAARLAKAKKVSAAEFKKQYAWVGRAQTVHDVSYLGQQDGKAYISENSRSPLTGKWSETLMYTPLEDLDAEFRASLPAKSLKNEPKTTAGKDPAGGAAKPAATENPDTLPAPADLAKAKKVSAAEFKKQ